MYSYGPPNMAKQKQDDQPELTYSSYVRTRDVTQKTCRRRWMIGRSGERWSRISVLVRHDDIYIYIQIWHKITYNDWHAIKANQNKSYIFTIYVQRMQWAFFACKEAIFLMFPVSDRLLSGDLSKGEWSESSYVRFEKIFQCINISISEPCWGFFSQNISRI